MCSLDHMNASRHSCFVPASLTEACESLRGLLCRRDALHEIPHADFVRGWSSIAFIAPGLHPDESGHDEGGWPVGWRCIADEAFRRGERGELADEQLYPYEAAKCALRLAIQ